MEILPLRIAGTAAAARQRIPQTKVVIFGDLIGIIKLCPFTA